ncbi:hypothetical protein [Nostoc sp.]|uniref:hypothetical protein n=1 Tax=Nostoc sp. TaxID=1180 RepID=UPI002FFBEB54
MLDVKTSPGMQFSRKSLWISFICLTAILFVLTGLVQFSCYPMITGGNLPKFCQSQETRLEIIKDHRTHGNVLLNLASNPESDESVLRALTSSLDSPKVASNPKKLQSALGFNPNTPIDVLDAFVKSEDVDILENISKRLDATPELLREVANNPHADAKKVQKLLVENPRAPEDVLQKLANSKEPEILWEIARLKQASSSVLREIYNNPVASLIEIQRKLASNKNIPEDILQKLANSTDSRVLSYVINHPSAYTSVLERVGENAIIWDDSKIGFQRTLAEKPNIPRKLIEKLASSNDRKVLESLYHDNPTVPPDIKEECRKKLGITQPPDVETFPPTLPLPLDTSNNPFSENNKSNCTGKHVLNNLIGGAVSVLGFLVGGPVGAVAAYGAMTVSLETVTTVSGCQL